MKCPNCAEIVPLHVRNCVSCQVDVGFPNVRAATTQDEFNALRKRLNDAKVSTRSRNCENVLTDFGNQVLNSKAVMCRSIGQVKQLIDDPNSMYASYYQQVGAQLRMPEDNSWDRGRPAVDSVLFPNYHKQICFAALSLDDRGLSTNYGNVAIVFKEPMIIHRATVFEENPFNFCKRHKVIAGTDPPFGYRTSWDKRHELAMSKLHGELSDSTQKAEYPAILLKNNGQPENDDFIEVHIFGSFNRSSIEMVTFEKPKKRADTILLRSMKIQLNKLGIAWDEY